MQAAASMPAALDPCLLQTLTQYQMDYATKVDENKRCIFQPVDLLDKEGPSLLVEEASAALWSCALTVSNPQSAACAGVMFLPLRHSTLLLSLLHGCAVTVGHGSSSPC